MAFPGRGDGAIRSRTGGTTPRDQGARSAWRPSSCSPRVRSCSSAPRGVVAAGRPGPADAGVPRGGERWASTAHRPPRRPAPRGPCCVRSRAQLRDPARPPWDRLAAASAGPVLAILTDYPLRDLISRSARYPVIVHRVRARSTGRGTSFSPRSEGVEIDPMGDASRGAARSGPRRSACPRSPRWGSTSSTCRRSTRSGARPARAPTTRCRPAPGTRLARRRSAPRRAATTRFIPISAR